MLFRETVAVHCENHIKNEPCVGRMQSFSILKQVVHIVATGLWRLGRTEIWSYLALRKEPELCFSFECIYFKCAIYSLLHFCILTPPPHNVEIIQALWSRGSSVGIINGYGLDGWGVGVPSPGGVKFFSFPRCPDRFWGPLSLLSIGYRELVPRRQSGRNVKLITHLQLVPISRMHGSIHPFPHKSS
jgi:hypothetical protein